MGERTGRPGALRRLETRRIVDRYLQAVERDAGPERLALEPSFIAVAADFGRRHGITASTWLEAKVSVEVLTLAGVIGAVVQVVESV